MRTELVEMRPSNVGQYEWMLAQKKSGKTTPEGLANQIGLGEYSLKAFTSYHPDAGATARGQPIQPAFEADDKADVVSIMRACVVSGSFYVVWGGALKTLKTEKLVLGYSKGKLGALQRMLLSPVIRAADSVARDIAPLIRSADIASLFR